MINREKVIKGLGSCAKWMKNNDEDACNSCPYHSHFSYDDNNCSATVNSDAILLLKEQEPIEPEVFMDGIIERYKCRRCGKHLVKTRFWKDNYCSLCGSEILWK